MCKVIINNVGNNYNTLNCTSLETDIPSELLPVLEKVFAELNKKRTNAICPRITIQKM